MGCLSGINMLIRQTVPRKCLWRRELEPVSKVLARRIRGGGGRLEKGGYICVRTTPFRVFTRKRGGGVHSWPLSVAVCETLAPRKLLLFVSRLHRCPQAVQLHTLDFLYRSLLLKEMLLESECPCSCSLFGGTDCSVLPE
eukprot:gene16628-biopygen6772